MNDQCRLWRIQLKLGTATREDPAAIRMGSSCNQVNCVGGQSQTVECPAAALEDLAVMGEELVSCTGEGSCHNRDPDEIGQDPAETGRNPAETGQDAGKAVDQPKPGRIHQN